MLPRTRRMARNRPVSLAGLVDGDDVGVVDRGLELALAAKARAEDRVLAEVRLEDLQRDGPVERQLRGLVDDAHPAPPEDRLDPVSRDLISGLHRAPFDHIARPSPAG